MLLTGPATTVRWALKHGLIRHGVRRAARAGDPVAALQTDPAARADPYPLYRQLRERAPLLAGPLVCTTARHDVATMLLRDDRFGVGFTGVQLPLGAVALTRLAEWRAPIGPVDPPSLLAVDPPLHSRLRRVVARVFTARAVEAQRPRIEERCAELLDDLAARGGDEPVDLVARYAALLPVTVIAEILGVPLAMRGRFLRWGAAGARTLDFGLSLREYRHAESGVRALNGWLRGHFARLRAEPGDDLFSRLVQLDGDDRLTGDELLATAGLVLAAGFETTVNLLGTGALLLHTHPEQRELLAEEPRHWPTAVEEMLRYDSPVQTTVRISRVATELHGVRLRPGTPVQVLLGGANRDPAVFDDPERFDITRPNARDHLSFSGGVHYCLGAALARIEAEIGLRALFTRFPHLTVTGPPHRRPTRVLRGYDAIPVRLGPAA
ncbi:cytochrome P450 [Melissospora conviva]|uniref:cytochrome P450 n=1 Tax=Melissospora conviva TaxID=3388432 RepID=UPI003C1647BD